MIIRFWFLLSYLITTVIRLLGIALFLIISNKFNLSFDFRRDRSKTPDRRIVGETVTTEKSSVFQSSSSNREATLKEKSPVPSKRKTPPPVARKSSSPGKIKIRKIYFFIFPKF